MEGAREIRETRNRGSSNVKREKMTVQVKSIYYVVKTSENNKLALNLFTIDQTGLNMRFGT